MSQFDKTPDRFSACKREEETASGSEISCPAAEQNPPRFENSLLPAAMLAVAKHDSPETRRILYESMLKTWFLVPTREAVSESPGFHSIQQDTSNAFSLEHDSTGQVVAVAFTDEEALRNWNKSIPWIALQGASFFQAVLNTEAEEIVINPFDSGDPNSKMIRPGGRITRWEFESLAGGGIPEVQPPDRATKQGSADSQSVLITMPKQMLSTEMLNVLADVARSFPEVVGMYFAQVIYPDGYPHWTVAVEFASGISGQQIGPVMSALDSQARQVFPENVATDLLPTATSLGQAIMASGKKIYEAAN
jgi:hypothetical protein